MLRFPVMRRTSGRQISLGGSGDTKDKLLVGALGLVIVVAIVGLVWSIVGRPDKYKPDIPNSFHLGCIVCDNEWDITQDQYYARMREMGEREVTLPRFLCPKCQDKRMTGFVMSQCPYPDCQKWYFPNNILRLAGKPTTEPPQCPHCGMDIMQGLRQYRSGKK